MATQRPKLAKRILKRMREVLEEAGDAVNATQATRAKMAEKILKKAAKGQAASHEELKEAAIEVGKKPAP